MSLTDQVTMPLSFTAIKSFEQCPQRFYQEKVLKKFPYVQSPQAKRGDIIHKEFENYIRDGVPLTLPDPTNDEVGLAKPFESWVQSIAKRDGNKHVEHKMAINWQGEKVGYFRGNDIWIRGQFDLLVEKDDKALMFDYKTGKSKYADTGQLELMALLTFVHFPKIQLIHGALLFIEENKVIKDEYSRDKMDLYKEKWLTRSIPIVQALTTRKFPMKQSGLCAYCPCIDCPFYKGD